MTPVAAGALVGAGPVRDVGGEPEPHPHAVGVARDREVGEIHAELVAGHAVAVEVVARALAHLVDEVRAQRRVVDVDAGVDHREPHAVALLLGPHLRRADRGEVGARLRGHRALARQPRLLLVRIRVEIDDPGHLAELGGPLRGRANREERRVFGQVALRVDVGVSPREAR